MSDDAIPPPRHEASDIGVRFALLSVAVLAGSLAVVIGIAGWMFPATVGARFVPPDLPRPVQPALQSSPRADMAALRRDKLAALDSYGWVDRDRGRVHIPITEAMRRVAAEGIAGWPKP